MKSFYLKSAVTAVLLGVGALAFGAGPGGGGGGGGGPPEGNGNRPDVEGGNNLSVPIIMIDGGFLLVCGDNEFSALDPVPDGAVPVYFDETCGPQPDPNLPDACSIPGHYFVQGVHKWQAPCMEKIYAEGDPKIEVYGAWGDNLSGDAKFSVGSPIRVELVLFTRDPIDGATSSDPAGYEVVKLEMDKLDREAAYGTQAFEAGGGGYAPDETFMIPLVHDGQATFSVQSVATGLYAVPPGTDPTAEINATGKIVYGYNLRLGAAGDYFITFNVPGIDFSLGCKWIGDDEGETCGAQETKIRITVGEGGGGGGGGGGKKPTKKAHPVHPRGK